MPGSAASLPASDGRQATSEKLHSLKDPPLPLPIGIMQASSDDKVQLRRQIGLIGGVAMIAGTMIGSGIFISPKDVLLRSGSVGTFLVVWLACGVLVTGGALCYIELACVVPKSGGTFVYLLEAFGPLHAFLGPLPAFLFTYTRTLLGGPSTYAVMTLSFGVYATRPFYHGFQPPSLYNESLHVNGSDPIGNNPNSPPVWLPKLVAAGCVVAITGINCLSVTLASRVQALFTAMKVGALVVIIVTGVVKLVQGHTGQLESGFTSFSGDDVTVSRVALAFYSGLFSYGGWNMLNSAVEELTDPYRTLPRAILIALPLVTVLYILTNISYLTVMTAAEILVEPAVAVEFGNRVFGVMAWIMPLAVVFSAVGSANGSAFANARYTFASAREGHLCSFLSFISVKWRTPLMALLVNGLITLLMIAMGNITTLIDLLSFTSWLFSGLAFTALLVLRRTRADVFRPYKVPILLPIFMVLASIALVILPIVQNPRIEALYGLLFASTALVFYTPLVYYRMTPTKFMGAVNGCIQWTFRVAPSKMDPEVVVRPVETKQVEGRTA